MLTGKSQVDGGCRSTPRGRDAMPGIKTEFLFTIALEVEVSNLGDTPYGSRRIFRLNTGSFEGPKLKGMVLPGGGGWSLMRRDDVLEFKTRLTLETDDKAQIYLNCNGLRHRPKEVIDRLNRGESVDPGTYYFRGTPYFETGSEKKPWMNRACPNFSGARAEEGAAYPECFSSCAAA